MRRPNQDELDLGLDPLPAAKADLKISAAPSKPLSPAQAEFNKRMKALERARSAHERERARLDEDLRVCITVLMPLVEKINRTDRDLVFMAVEARRSMKLTPRRHKWLGDLISGKAADLLADPVGLDGSEIDRLEALIAELGTSLIDEEQKEMERDEFEMMRGMIEEVARRAGVKLDLGDLDLNSAPAEFERQFHERIAAATEKCRQTGNGGEPIPAPKRGRKPTKAALEREQRQRGMEEAKTKDFKSLYKQLAKVLHPDLETDPVLKEHKEIWMKRLTTARANGDLRDMLAIELEWLGEEASNLAKAGDEKLRVYSMVLKEQLDELKEQTRFLIHEPQYQPLFRFAGPFGVLLPPARVKLDLSDQIAYLEEMVDVLRAGGKEARTMVQQWADDHARACKR